MTCRVNPGAVGVRAARPRRRQVIRFVARVALGGALLCQFVPAPVGSTEAAPEPPPVREVRSILTAEHGAARPIGLAAPEDGTLLVAYTRGQQSRETRLLHITPAGDPLTTRGLPRLADPETLAYDAAGDRLTTFDGGALASVADAGLDAARPALTRSTVASLGLRDPQGATFDPDTGTWYVVDNATRTIVRTPMLAGAPGTPSHMSLRHLRGARFQGLALNPRDGLLYVASPDTDLLYGLDRSGALRRTFSLESLGVKDLRALLFAPSADPTDDPATLHLFIADAGDASTFGRVIETTLAADVTAAAATVVSGSLVQTIDVSQLNPPSPDPAGITYLPAADRLELSDSEVDEMPIYQGVNLFQITRGGQLTNTGVTQSSSREPAGAGFNPANGMLFLSDDDANKVFTIRPGADGRYGTPDDLRSNFSTVVFGSQDPEGLEYDATSGHLFIADGTAREVYDINPVNGTFGDGNDVVTSFDVEQHGVLDPEGMGVDTARGTLLVVDRVTERVYEVSTSGALIRVIDLAAASPRNPAGITVAPGTNNPSVTNYWVVDRGVDNNTDPNENDGKVYEISVPVVDSPPTVTITGPADGATVSGSVAVQADANDDQGVTQVQFLVDGAAIGSDTNGADGWSATWDTTTVADGNHTLEARATDTAGQTGTDANGVTVDNVDTPPSVAITGPASGSVVSGTVGVQATANDDRGVTEVGFLVDGAVIGTDANGSNGWSATWDTTTVADGNHTLQATATDTGGQTGTSAAVPVTVANSGGVLTQDVAVAAGLDDVEERSSGAMWVATSDLDLVVDSNGNNLQTVGLRFNGVGAPPGASIVNAYVQFQTDEVSTGPTNLTVRAQAADNAAPFTTAKFNLSSRPRTSASIAWVPPGWTQVGARGAGQRTPDLSPVLQEVVNRPGWSSGSSLVLVVTGSGSRVAEAFEGTFAPVLHVEFTTF